MKGRTILQVTVSLVSALLLLSMHIEDPFFLFLALLNSTIAIWGLFSYEDRPYTIHKLVNLFILFFFVLANAIQFSHHSIVTSIWIDFNKYEYRSFQFIVLLILLLFNTLYAIFITHNQQNEPRVIVSDHSARPVRLVVLAFIATALVLYHYRDNITFLFFRGIEGVYHTEDARAGGHGSSLLFGKFIRVIPWACFLIAGMLETKKSVRFILFLTVLVTLFPTGLSRNAIAMYWLPCALVYLKRVFDRKHLFAVVMIVGLLAVFPIFGGFRYYGGSIDFSSVNLDYLDSMNFDASQMFMAVIKMNIITYGRQLLGPLFFFVPRSMWEDKPIGSGAYVAETQFAFSNISMPFWGEGYINFGWVGVFLFTIVLAIVSFQLDRHFWYKQSNNRFYISNGYYYILLGVTVYLLRGDLLSPTAYTVGAIAAYWMSVKLVTIKEKA